MSKDAGLGLDELMIVNPGPRGLRGLYLGADGTVYQAQALGPEATAAGPYYLSADGTLYQEQRAVAGGSSGFAGGGAPGEEPGRYFLGADGAIYEVVGPSRT